MSISTVQPTISPTTDTVHRLQQLRIRIAGRLRLGLRFETTRYGLRRDLTIPFPAPDAKIPISVRPLAETDLAILLAVNADTSEADRFEITWRQAFAAKRLAGGYVAIDERDGRPCYVQWLFGAADNDFIRSLHGFPELAPDEALLENAYTPASHRGLGIMPAAMARIAEKAETIGARYVITFVEQNNTPRSRAASAAASRRTWNTSWRGTASAFSAPTASPSSRTTPRGARRNSEHLSPDGSAQHPLKMRARPFTKGIRIVTRTGGGGGYGDPLARPLAEVAEDVRAGLVSPESAWTVYGVRFAADLSVDEAASRPRAEFS